MNSTTGLYTGHTNGSTSTYGQSGSTGPSRSAAEASIVGLVSSTQAQDLLFAVVGFIQPIIRAYAPASGSSAKLDIDGSQPGLHDTQLLDALRNFVKSIVSSEETQWNHQKECDDAQLISEHPRNAPEVPLSIHDTYNVNTLMNAVRSRVFSKMPIRMLAFNSPGSGIRLLDRNEIVNFIFHSAYVETTTPEFTKKYNKYWRFPTTLVNSLVQKHSGYAILSHTWKRDTPGDVVFTTWNGRTANPEGNKKITNFCRVAAREHGVRLGWMDTVCINKESSSELDESIRSMYKWYQGADICVAYMSETETWRSMHADNWFRRGWTLQELLAPKKIQFYNRNWNVIQNDDDSHLRLTDPYTIPAQGQIERATTITPTEIAHCRRGKADLIPISRKFQLAANRIVTREEDQAYSLMGLMGVDISVAYGEGAERALFRLQREILATKKCPLDIFNCEPGDDNKLLPSHLKQYRSRTKEFDCHDNEVGTTLDLWIPTEPLVCTHLGVRLQVILLPGIFSRITSMDGKSAKGKFYGTYRASSFRTFDHAVSSLLLHRDIYKKVDPRHAVNYYNPKIVHFGVINFTVKNNFITFPDTCLAVPFNCRITPGGTVTQSDDMNIFPTSGPVTFKIESGDGTRGTSVHDLERHGMQLLTLHL